MSDLYLFNSLTRKKEKFEAIDPPNVGIYSCGPTVYDYATIGNFRTYTSADILVRVLKYNGYRVKYVMNLTDVGHLTGDNLGDADTGEDRLEKTARKERKTAWDVAKFYTDAFYTDFEKLNLTKPEKFVKATDHIREQIDLVKKLEEKGLTYKTSDGIYFNTVEYEKKTGRKYGELSTLDRFKEGARVEANPEKKNPRDFALWKFSPKGVKRDMEWESPWAPPGARSKVMGFPGWHIECSAMSMKYLGETFDIHIGGEDLRSTHHPNEIAQAEGATGKKFVNYWLHGAFLKVDGGRMGKSLGNAYTVSDIEKKDFDPLALRYFYLSGKYNEPLNFTWDSLEAAKRALEKLGNLLQSFKNEKERMTLSAEKNQKIESYRNRFSGAVNDDLNLPQALSVLWEMLKSSIPSRDKYDLAMSFDEVLGLKLDQVQVQVQVPEKVKSLIDQRNKLRKKGKYEEADKLRNRIESLGFTIKDKRSLK
jgi:cysteinyl-tRNA synthetase